VFYRWQKEFFEKGAAAFQGTSRRTIKPEAKPPVISDYGPQFIAWDFRKFIGIAAMTHVRTSHEGRFKLTWITYNTVCVCTAPSARGRRKICSLAEGPKSRRRAIATSSKRADSGTSGVRQGRCLHIGRTRLQ
jgi:hypothetical protein